MVSFVDELTQPTLGQFFFGDFQRKRPLRYFQFQRLFTDVRAIVKQRSHGRLKPADIPLSLAQNFNITQ